MQLADLPCWWTAPPAGRHHFLLQHYLPLQLRHCKLRPDRPGGAGHQLRHQQHSNQGRRREDKPDWTAAHVQCAVLPVRQGSRNRRCCCHRRRCCRRCRPSARIACHMLLQHLGSVAVLPAAEGGSVIAQIGFIRACCQAEVSACASRALHLPTPDAASQLSQTRKCWATWTSG